MEEVNTQLLICLDLNYMKFIILLVTLRSVQMRLYSMHKREFVMVFLAFFACFGLGVFIGLAGNYYYYYINFSGASYKTNMNN